MEMSRARLDELRRQAWLRQDAEDEAWYEAQIRQLSTTGEGTHTPLLPVANSYVVLHYK